ncbi:hypothetical protein QBC39DRAFT_50727 [Podospora conica]|nr:hypothetical protein QBC39DRAFT_50727 [Schizothecium conicum]
MLTANKRGRGGGGRNRGRRGENRGTATGAPSNNSQLDLAIRSAPGEQIAGHAAAPNLSGTQASTDGPTGTPVQVAATGTLAGHNPGLAASVHAPQAGASAPASSFVAGGTTPAPTYAQAAAHPKRKREGRGGLREAAILGALPPTKREAVLTAPRTAYSDPNTLQCKTDGFVAKHPGPKYGYHRLIVPDDQINWYGKLGSRQLVRMAAKVQIPSPDVWTRLHNSVVQYAPPGAIANVIIEILSPEQARAEFNELMSRVTDGVAAMSTADDYRPIMPAKRNRRETREPGQAQGHQVQSSQHPGPRTADQFRDPNAKVCANCRAVGHELSECSVANPITGCIPGCPRCNVPPSTPGADATPAAHHFDDCPNGQPYQEPTAETVFQDERWRYLVKGRANKPAIRTVAHFYLAVALYLARHVAAALPGLGSLLASEVFPWTDAFALSRKGFTHEQNAGVQDPFWEGKTFGEVVDAFITKQLEFEHLKYFPGGPVARKARDEKLLIRIALERALKHGDFRLWISETETDTQGKVWAFERVKLETDPGGLAPTPAKETRRTQDATDTTEQVVIKSEPTDDVEMTSVPEEEAAINVFKTAPTPKGSTFTPGLYRDGMIVSDEGDSTTNAPYYDPNHEVHTGIPDKGTLLFARKMVEAYLAGRISPGHAPNNNWGLVFKKMLATSEQKQAHQHALQQELQNAASTDMVQ